MVATVEAVRSRTYWTKQCAANYYADPAEPVPVFLGSQAAKYGLLGKPATKELIEKFFDGYAPDGTKMVQNAGQKDRPMGQVLTLTLDQTVAALYAVSPPERRRQMDQDFDEAARKMVSLLEAEIVKTRRGKGGQIEEPAQLVVLDCAHLTNRNQECMPHRHLVIFHACGRGDGTTGSTTSFELYKYQKLIGAMWHSDTGAGLERRGVQTEKEQSWFRVAGVPEIPVWATRGKEIEAKLAEWGTTRSSASARAKEAASLITRKKKTALPGRAELHERWEKEAREFHWGPEEARTLFGEPRRRDYEREAKRVAAVALTDLTKTDAYFTRKQLMERIAVESQGRGLSAAHVIATTNNLLASKEVVRLGEQQRVTYYSTPAVMAVEKRILGFAEQAKGSTHHDVRDRTLARAVRQTEQELTAKARAKNPKAKAVRLSEEQRAGLKKLGQTHSTLAFLQGPAGSGKTAALRALTIALEAEGLKPIGLAPTGRGAKELANSTGLDSLTIDRFLLQTKPGKIGFRTFHGRQFSSLWSMLKFAEKVRKPKIRLTRDSVIILDEASLTSSTKLHAVLEAARKARGGPCKVVCVGDERQLPPIEHGGPYKSLLARHTELTAHIRTVQRQREPWLREAVAAVAERKPQEALSAFEKKGLLHRTQTPGEARAALIEQWAADPLPANDKLVLANLNEDVRALNQMAQAHLRDRGELGRRSLPVGGYQLHRGDRIVFKENHTSELMDVRNGEFGTVVGVGYKKSPWLSVRRDDGTVVSFPLADYDKLSLGYAVNAWGAQGATTEQAYTLLGGKLESAETAYVKLSRSRGDTHVFVAEQDAGPKLERLHRELSRSTAKVLAHDYLDKSQAIEPSPSLPFLEPRARDVERHISRER